MWLDRLNGCFQPMTSRCRCQEWGLLPSSLLMNGCVLNGSKSSMCSPVPMKIMGLLVAATLTGNSRRRRTLTQVESVGFCDITEQALRAQSSSSFGMSVKFGDDHWRHIHFVFEGFSLRLAGLSDRRIHHVHNVVRLLWKQEEEMKHTWDAGVQVPPIRYRTVTVCSGTHHSIGNL